MNHVSLTGPEGYRSEVHEERRKKKEGRRKKKEGRRKKEEGKIFSSVPIYFSIRWCINSTQIWIIGL
jgi:hypothetical protein